MNMSHFEYGVRPVDLMSRKQLAYPDRLVTQNCPCNSCKSNSGCMSYCLAFSRWVATGKPQPQQMIAARGEKAKQLMQAQQAEH